MTDDVTEQAARVIADVAVEPMWSAVVIARALADAGLLARPLPTRDEVARAIDPAIYPDINHLTGKPWAASKRAADAVLALLEGDKR